MVIELLYEMFSQLQESLFREIRRYEMHTKGGFEDERSQVFLYSSYIPPKDN